MSRTYEGRLFHHYEYDVSNSVNHKPTSTIRRGKIDLSMICNYYRIFSTEWNGAVDINDTMISNRFGDEKGMVRMSILRQKRVHCPVPFMEKILYYILVAIE